MLPAAHAGPAGAFTAAALPGTACPLPAGLDVCSYQRLHSAAAAAAASQQPVVVAATSDTLDQHQQCLNATHNKPEVLPSLLQLAATNSSQAVNDAATLFPTVSHFVCTLL